MAIEVSFIVQMYVGMGPHTQLWKTQNDFATIFVSQRMNYLYDNCLFMCTPCTFAELLGFYENFPSFIMSLKEIKLLECYF